MRPSMKSLLPTLLLAACLPAQAQSQEPARAGGSIAGKATAKTAPASPAAKAAADRKRLQVTAGAIPAATAPAQSTSPVASPSVPAAAKDKSHCHSSGNDA